MKRPSPEERLDELDRILTALSHRARRQILLTLHFRGGRMSAGDIAGRFAHAWPTTTRHLQALESAGLIRGERQGRSRVYHLAPDLLDRVQEWLGWFKKGPQGK